MSQNNIRFLTEKNRGWARMWDKIAHKYGSYTCYNHSSGEQWQYLGTVNNTHQFRHRSLPPDSARFANVPEKAEQRIYEYVPALSDDFEEVGEEVGEEAGKVRMLMLVAELWKKIVSMR